MATRRFTLVLLLAGSCAGELSGGGGGLPPELGELRIVSPLDGDAIPRDEVDANGNPVAAITFQAEGDARLVEVEWLAEGTFSLGVSTAPDFSLVYQYMGDGARWVQAVGRDENGAVIAQANVSFTVLPPAGTDCLGSLMALGVDFTVGPDRQGIPEPVTVTLPIRGIGYRYVSNQSPRDTFLMDCQLALALWRAGEIFAAHGVVEVADIGVYNYRCIGGGTPPDCPNGISMHAYAQAIDIAGVTDQDGLFYSVNDDWVIDSGATCDPAMRGQKDAFLHDILCDLYDAGVFSIYLTPNYNDAHRNHWHVDLTEGSDFIKREALLDVLPYGVPGAH